MPLSGVLRLLNSPKSLSLVEELWDTVKGDVASVQCVTTAITAFIITQLVSVLEKSCVAPAMQELVGERTTEVSPALEDIFLAEEGIEKFVAARQLTNRPVTIASYWDRDLRNDWLLEYDDIYSH
jgi:hypothetical protein